MGEPKSQGKGGAGSQFAVSVGLVVWLELQTKTK